MADVAALHRSTHDGSLLLLFQPEVDLGSGAIVAMEALLRWHHHDFGLLAPRDFLELAERNGDLADIDRWVVRTAAAEAASWQGMPGQPRRLWINASTSQLASPDFAALVASVIVEHGLPFGVIGLDITEESVVALGDRAMAVLTALHEAGAALAIDDSSTWIATLGAIRDLPFDVVKLGHRFVRGVDEFEDPTSVQALIDAAHAKGVDVVAEGVESWGESACLTDMGCDRAHGYWFASPMHGDRARWLLRQGSGWRGSVVGSGDPAIPVPRTRS